MPIGTWSLPMPQSGCSGLTQRASTQRINSSACCVSDASFDWIYIDAIWDRLNAHRSRATTDFIASHAQDYAVADLPRPMPRS
jgi:hypothetical protein